MALGAGGDTIAKGKALARSLLDHGVFFTGLARTCHAKYPPKTLGTKVRKERGDTYTMTADANGEKVTAHTWFDHKPKNLVTTCGVTGAADLHLKKRHRNSNGGGSTVYYKAIRRSKVVKDYLDGASVIDVDSHLWQHGQDLESAWGAHRWDHRIAATTVGMCEVDAYLAYVYFEPGKGDVTHGEFTKRLALKLIHNDFPGSGVYRDKRYRTIATHPAPRARPVRHLRRHSRGPT